MVLSFDFSVCHVLVSLILAIRYSYVSLIRIIHHTRLDVKLIFATYEELEVKKYSSRRPDFFVSRASCASQPVLPYSCSYPMFEQPIVRRPELCSVISEEINDLIQFAGNRLPRHPVLELPCVPFTLCHNSLQFHATIPQRYYPIYWSEKPAVL